MKIHLGLPGNANLPYERWAMFDTDKKELIRESTLTNDRLRTYCGGLHASDESDNSLNLTLTGKGISVERDGLQVALLNLPVETTSLVLNTIPFPNRGAIGNDPLSEFLRLQFCLRLSEQP